MNSNGSENKSDRNLRSGRRTVALAEISDEPQDSSVVFHNPQFVKAVNTTSAAGSSLRARRAAPTILVAANPRPTTRRSLANEEQRAEVDEIVPSSSGSKLRRRKRVEGAEEESNPYMDLASIINRAHSEPELEMPRSRRRKHRQVEDKGKGRESISVYQALPESFTNTNTLPPLVTQTPPSKRFLHEEPSEPHCMRPSAIMTTPSPIKRIKLIVRRPPPLISSPTQKIPTPTHAYSLSNLLSSYTTDGFEEVPAGVLASRARSQARILERARTLEKQSLFLSDQSVLKLSPAEVASKKRNTRDIWDHCIQDVIEYLELKSEEPSGSEIASQISRAIQSYWDVQAVKREKMQAKEDRRIRALAKATIKLVTGEWKKAVFHLREQERLKLEAEEVRQGHAHLDAILDQSGQILETQHGDLSRVRSRSSSASTESMNWAADDHEEERKGDDNANGGGADVKANETEKLTSLDVVMEENPTEGLPVSSHGLHSLLSRSNEDNAADSQPRSSSLSLHNSSHFLAHLLSSSSDPSSSFYSSNTSRNSHRSFGNSIHDPIDVDEESNPSTPDVVTPPNTLTLVGVHDAKAEAADASMSVEEADNVFMSDPHPIQANSSSADIQPTVIEAFTESGPISIDPSTPRSLPRPKDPEMEEGGLSSQEDEDEDEDSIPTYLKPYAVSQVEWNPNSKIAPPVLLRGILRPYQFSGLEWLASLHSNNLNGILADEMGLGKTIQTIALLAHLACDRGIWGPHLIIVPTSVLLNWEMEFKKFLPGFRILSYHGTTKRRKELRQGWNDKYHFNVCITSYTLASRDAHIFKRKNWYYMILDEAHMIKNFKSQRWNVLLLFRSFRRLLLTGTPLQNNLTELWALLQFLMSGSKFANLKEFGDWFSNPLEKAIESGNIHDDDTLQRVSKLHTVLRPYLLRRLKRDVEKELPSKYEHLVPCSLSKRQRFLYDEFMARAHTRDALQSGVYQKIANILMQLRKVCNHPDLFEVRPIVTSFAMSRSAIADFEIKELLVRRRLLVDDDNEKLNLEVLGISFVNHQNTSVYATLGSRSAHAGTMMMEVYNDPGPAPPKDTRTIEGFRKYSTWQRRASTVARWSHTAYLNRLRYARSPIYSSETISLVRSMYDPILPFCHVNTKTANYVDNVLPAVHKAVLSYEERSSEMADVIDRFAFVTPTVIARDVAKIALAGLSPDALAQIPLSFDEVIHNSAVKLSIAFPSPSLLQYDCGKLQRLTSLLREKKAGGHRVLLFTQMTKVLDILEIYLNFHGYLYLRLDGATSIEDRQYVTERFNKDEKIFCFIASSRSGGVGINLTGADTVIFYDSDFNPQMDRQCEDRAHRIGQIRDVHVYRFVSQHTVEEAMLLKANQKRSLDDLVIQKGQFDWSSLFRFDSDESTSVARGTGIDSGLLTKALGEFEDSEDALAAKMAEREEVDMEGADEADFGVLGEDEKTRDAQIVNAPAEVDGDEEEGGTTVDYMLAYIAREEEFFAEWRL